MARRGENPTLAIRRKAGGYAGVDEGTACTQSSFKIGSKAFLFIGEQGGRYKAMFKLAASRDDARRRAEKEPDRFQVGSSPWVTARFTAEDPLPKTLWMKWLDESYALGVGASGSRAASDSNTTARKKPAGKKTTRKKTATR